MKKLLSSIIFLQILIFAPLAQAEEVDPKFFKDWLTLSSLLSSKGILPSAPSWAIINPMCLPLKKYDDEYDFNRCLYEKAMDEYQWQIDNKFCAERADKEFADYVQYQKSVGTSVIIDKDGNKQIVKSDFINLNPQQRTYKDRAIFYQDCMTLVMNWKNHDRWLTGHRKEDN